MLQSLFIANYALIDRLEIDFTNGLNIITGETGAGKSILLSALSLLMGERADTRSIRDAERKTIVEARFDISSDSDINSILEVYDIDRSETEIILRREISAKGNSRAFINDTPVNLNLIKEVSEKLLDIHTQHENLLLADASFQLNILDIMADNGSLLNKLNIEYESYRKALKRYTELRDNLKRIQSESEYNSYLLDQLDNLNLEPGEQEQLEKERDIAANTAEIKTRIKGALSPLLESDRNALSLIDAATNNLEHLGEFMQDAQALAERLESARVEINDIAETLQELDSTISDSELSLDDIERRLGELYSLEARHNVSTSDELIEVRERLRNNLKTAQNGEELLEEFENEAKLAKKQAVLTARTLTQNRTEVAKIFENLLMEKAKPLGLSNLRCEIRISPKKLGKTGMDEVEFLFAFNKNQSLMPVGKTASGGEIARVILAVKSILAQRMKLPTIIFDEVDTGVSGDIATKMAKLMVDISKRTQVITITHIATVAAHGITHFKVYKQDGDDSTLTLIKKLSDSERPIELASIISGKPSDPTAILTAKEMLKSTEED